jgi:hypothetical protein
MARKDFSMLYGGDFHSMTQERQEGSDITLVTLSRRGEDTVYRFRVKDLYGPNEEVLEDEVIKVVMPAHIKKRVKEAMKDAKTKQ